MPRSIKKGPYIDEKLLNKIEKMESAGRKEMIKTWARRSTVVPEFIGYTFAIHNGKKFIPVLITENMVGHKLGEFAPTRTFRSHARGEKTASSGSAKGLSASEVSGSSAGKQAAPTAAAAAKPAATPAEKK